MPYSISCTSRTNVSRRTRTPTTQRRRSILCALSCLALYGCSDGRQTADTDDNAFIIGGGLLTLDTHSAGARDVFAADRDGNRLSGVVVLRPGVSIIIDAGSAHAIEASPQSLSVFDNDGDGRIDAADPLWQSLHLAVDYDGDGAIGDGEFALIGECGVEALKLDPAAGLLWSVHARGRQEPVRTPGRTL